MNAAFRLSLAPFSVLSLVMASVLSLLACQEHRLPFLFRRDCSSGCVHASARIIIILWFWVRRILPKRICIAVRCLCVVQSC